MTVVEPQAQCLAKKIRMFVGKDRDLFQKTSGCFSGCREKPPSAPLNPREDIPHPVNGFAGNKQEALPSHGVGRPARGDIQNHMPVIYKLQHSS